MIPPSIQKLIEAEAGHHYDDSYAGKYFWTTTNPIEDFKAGAEFIAPYIRAQAIQDVIEFLKSKELAEYCKWEYDFEVNDELAYRATKHFSEELKRLEVHNE